MKRWAVIILICLTTSHAAAQDQRPIARGFANPEATAEPLRPSARLQGLGEPSEEAVERPILPRSRPTAIIAAAEDRCLASLRGQVCNDPIIQGKVVGRVAGAGACGIDEAVMVRSVAGITLDPHPTVDCRTAVALKTWVERGVLPAVGSDGGGAVSLRVVADYACRARNNQAGARLSEHAFGRAIDVAGIGLRDGSEITVLTDWNLPDDGAKLRKMWRAACGPFGTVLGPEANRFHRDHFHFDTAQYRSRSFCS